MNCQVEISSKVASFQIGHVSWFVQLGFDDIKLSAVILTVFEPTVA
jgi:hypothetical protein